MRPTTQPHLSALSFSAVPCEIDYSEPYSTPWAISPESVLPVGPSVCLLIQYACRFCQRNLFLFSGFTAPAAGTALGSAV